MKFTAFRSVPRLACGSSKVFISAALAVGLIEVLSPYSAIASNYSKSASATALSQASPTLIATAYTDITLPTLRRGDRGKNVQRLQQILMDDGFLSVAGVRLGNVSGAAVDGVFGSVTESAVRDLQQRHHIPVTGRVDPSTWEALDMYENPYRSPLPWKPVSHSSLNSPLNVG